MLARVRLFLTLFFYSVCHSMFDLLVIELQIFILFIPI
jgi:hypothetical protein